MGTNVAVAPKQQRIATLKDLLAQPQYADRFRQVLGERAPQFVSSVIAVSNGFGKPVDPRSVIAAAMQAATLDLPVNKDLGFAWIIPYGGVAQFQMGARGYVQLALRTGQYKTINVCDVRDGEFKSYNKLTGKLMLDDNEHPEKKIVGYAAYFELVNGFEKSEYWSIDRVKEHAQRFSQSYKSGRDSPWKSDFDAMSRKTVLKSLLSRWGILSVQMQDAITGDQAARPEVESDSGVTYPDNGHEDQPHEEAESKTERMADALSERMNQSPPVPTEDISHDDPGAILDDQPSTTEPPQVQQPATENPPPKRGPGRPRKQVDPADLRGPASPAWDKFDEVLARMPDEEIKVIRVKAGVAFTPWTEMRTQQLEDLSQRFIDYLAQHEIAEADAEFKK